MRPIHLVLGSYNSQALDLSASDRDALYEHAYKPLLKLLYNRPDVRFTLYYSGPLIEWLEKHHSEFVDVLTEMVRRRQVELLGGAYFEPFMPLIPKVDRIGQIERLTTYLRKCFGRRPRGAWIPESVWDQRLASNFVSGGIEYVFIDEDAFALRAEKGTRGRRQPAVYGPILTEDQGKTLTLFPLARTLSNDFFRVEPAEIVSRLERIAQSMPADGEGVAVVSLLFDGTLVGYDPAKAALAVEWFSRLLDGIVTAGDWLRVRTPYRIMRTRPPLERRFAAVSTQAGIMDWTRGIEADSASGAKSQDDGTTFRSILESYPESQRLYARMQHTHVLVNQVRGDKYRKMTARDDLWRGQSHWAYWNNPSGGIYRSSLRKATYAALIDAEVTTREKGIFIPSISRLDVDLDGDEEILYQGNELNAYLHRHGGHLFELDWLARSWNYLDTMQRRSEPFHDEATRAAGYDSWPRAAFVDHLLEAGHDRASFASGHRRLAADLSLLPYRVEDLDKEHSHVTFAAETAVGGELSSLSITKRYTFIRNRIDVTWVLENGSLVDIDAIFATEINLSFHSLDAGKLRLSLRQGRSRRELPPDTVEADGISELQLYDLHNNTVVTIHPADRPGLWCFPVEAVGVLGMRPHWYYQSNCIVLGWPLALASGARVEFGVSLRIEPKK